MLAGPALAGFTIGLWGSWVAFVFDSVSFFVSAAAIFTMSIPFAVRRPKPEGSPLGSVLEEMKDGVGFMFKSRVLAPMIAAMMVASLCTSAIQVVWVPFLQRTFNVGAEGLGIVDSAQGVGMLIAGFMLGFLSARFKKISLAAICLTVIGLGFAGTGLAHSFWVVILLTVAVGIATLPAGSIVMTIMQMVVPDEKRGLVSSAINAMATSAGLVAMALAALLGEAIGLRNVYILCGLANLAAAVLTIIIGVEPEPAPAAVTG